MDKVSFNGVTRKITVNVGVTSLDIRTDVYSAWVRWVQLNPWATQAMRFTGADIIPNGETGVTFFLINNWKLVYDPTITTISGVLYSENYLTAFWSSGDLPLYPATVSSLVNSAVSYQNVITGTALTEEQLALAIRAALAVELSRIDKKISSRATAADIIALSK